MLRWHILRTLLHKEVLRYRYNWGLLVVVFALLALSGLVSIGSRYKKLLGEGSDAVQACHVLYQPSEETESWVRHLKKSRPPGAVYYREHRQQLEIPPRMPADAMAIQLMAPARGTAEEPDRWKVCYWYTDDGAPGITPYRDWFARETRAFLKTQPSFEEESRKGAYAFTAPLERVPLIVTALVIFALYLLSFNLYITSTGEEREKRVLLGLLLSPASPLEVVAAKAIFYASSSLAVALAVAGMSQPQLLFNPLLWATIVSGSVGYVAIGTVVVSIVRRQTTINTVSMLYLMMTTIIIFLSQFIPLFTALKFLLMENYLYSQLQQLIGGKMALHWLLPNQVVLLFSVGIWSLIAILVFNRQATSIARSR